MKRHHTRVREPKGRITVTRKQADMGGIKLYPSTRPVLLVTVRTHTRHQRHAFLRWCQHHGVTVKVAGQQRPPKVERWVDEQGVEVPEEPLTLKNCPRGATTQFEVSGGPSLEGLTKLDCVVSWCYPLDVGAPRLTIGTFWGY